jgi:hypothetical protein
LNSVREEWTGASVCATAISKHLPFQKTIDLSIYT